MTRIEYDLLRAQEPALRLPHWVDLQHDWRNNVLSKISREAFTAARVAFLMYASEEDLRREWFQRGPYHR